MVSATNPFLPTHTPKNASGGSAPWKSPVIGTTPTGRSSAPGRAGGNNTNALANQGARLGVKRIMQLSASKEVRHG
ncbi:MAG: hypothetical protein V3U90_08320 [Dehalococcoidia bacterium]